MKSWYWVIALIFIFGSQTLGQIQQPSTTNLEQRIAAAVEESRKGNQEAFSKVYYELKRPEALKYLRNYVDDPDSAIRWQIAISVRGQHTMEAIQVLSDLIRNKAGLFLPEAVSSLETYYDCRELREHKPKNLVPNLIAAAQANFKSTLARSEIRLLGCLADSDPEAKKFLIESSSSCEAGKLVLPQFKETQCWSLNLALAKSGNKDAVRKLLADFKASSNEGDPNELKGWIETIQYIDDKELLLGLSELVKDKRFGPAPIPHLSENGVPISDMAISAFTRKLGANVTGEKDAYWRKHSDEEVEKIYGRLRAFLSR
jgi:HEAT repeat protein